MSAVSLQTSMFYGFSVVRILFAPEVRVQFVFLEAACSPELDCRLAFSLDNYSPKSVSFWNQEIATLDRLGDGASAPACLFEAAQAGWLREGVSNEMFGRVHTVHLGGTWRPHEMKRQFKSQENTPSWGFPEKGSWWFQKGESRLLSGGCKGNWRKANIFFGARLFRATWAGDWPTPNKWVTCFCFCVVPEFGGRTRRWL